MKDTDVAVLDYIFDPNISLGLGIHGEKETEIEELITIDNGEDLAEEAMISKLELEGVKAAEQYLFDEAIQKFSKSIEVSKRSSGYNNRAQVYRLLGDDTRALEDLETALRISNRKDKAYRFALCQRGILYRKSGEENKAKEDFKLAAELGSNFAKKQLVEMNPYAAMCNQMLHQMMSRFNTIENDF